MHNITLDPDLIWAKILDPNPNSMYSIWIHNTGFKNWKLILKLTTTDLVLSIGRLLLLPLLLHDALQLGHVGILSGKKGAHLTKPHSRCKSRKEKIPQKQWTLTKILPIKMISKNLNYSRLFFEFAFGSMLVRLFGITIQSKIQYTLCQK